MRLMRSHNLAYFRWFLEHKKSRLHIAVQTGFMLIQAIKMRVMRPHELPVVVRFVGTIYS